MDILINDRKIRLSWHSVLYFLITSFFFFYVVKDLQFNTAFVDEAIYATVGEEVLRGFFWESAISWMGGSYLYPLVSALINRQFGLAGVRFFSVLCVLITGLIAGKIGRQIGGKKTELITLFLFFFSAISLDLAQHATYDAPSLLFTSLAVFFAIKSRSKHHLSELLLAVASGIAISLAILSKYVAIFFVPVIFLIILVNKKRINILPSFSFAMIIAAIILIYLSYSLDGVMNYFSGSYSQEPETFTNILKLIAGDVGLPFAGFFFALIYLFWPKNNNLPQKPGKQEARRVALFLLLAGAMPVLYHLGASNARSLWKHMVFTSFFWVPVTALLFSKLYLYVYQNKAKEGLMANLSQLLLTIFVLLIVTNLWFSFSSHWRFQRSWPSATNAITYLRENMTHDDKIFAEGSAVYKYHLFSGFGNPYAWSSTWYLEYEGETGVEAMKLAIQKKEFDFIILNGYFTGYINEQLMPDIYNSYTLELVDIYKVSGVYDNTTTIWKPKS